MKRKICYMFIIFSFLLCGCGQTNSPSDTNHSYGNEANIISEDEAELIALNHAGLNADEVTFIKSSRDFDNGQKNYDVEFFTQDSKEYNYEINGYNGEIIEWDVEAPSR